MLVIRFGYILLCYPVVAVESYTVHEKLGPFIIKKALIDILYPIKKEGSSREWLVVHFETISWKKGLKCHQLFLLLILEILEVVISVLMTRCFVML